MTRDDISALLPFLANGTLEGNERAKVEAAVADDPELATELEVLRAIRTTMQAEQAFSPGDIGLARLMREVETEETPAANTNRRPLVWQIAAAILLAVVVGQTVYQFVDPQQPGGYQLAGGDAPAFTVAFGADVSEADMRTLLQSAGVEIVGGPSALGFYALAPLEGVAINDARNTLESSALIETLQSADP